MGAIALAVLVGAWLFAYKVRDFTGLGTTSDLYTFVQMSTTWPDRGFFHDNYWGDALTVHSFLFSPILWPLARPFGAYGLFMALAFAMALSLLAMERILRWFGIPPRWALAFSTLVTAMPLSVQTYQNVLYGFHPEQLEPVFALWLAYHLFKRAWSWAFVNALGLVLLKEDAPLLLMAVAATVVGEDLFRNWLGRDPNSRFTGWNRPALVVIAFGALAIPILLFVIEVHQPPGAPSNLSRLQPTGRETSFNSYRDLVDFVLRNVGHWLKSESVTDWRNFLLPATLGLALLRPHLVLIGLVTTVVAWLRNDNLIWAPRFVQTLTLFQLASCLGFVSAWRIAERWRGTAPAPRRLPVCIVAATGIGVTFWSLRAQFEAVPEVAEYYSLRPKQRVSPVDRDRADRLFAAYRTEGRREEPVVATTYLFRYAHDRDLLWPIAIRGRPAPVWILWDTEDTSVMGLWTFLKRDAGTDLSNYELRGRDGRFILLKRRTGPQPVATLDNGIPALTGETSGAIRLKVRLPTRQIGHNEPLLSLGTHDRGDVFQVSYPSANRIALRVERIGIEIIHSNPIDCDFAQEHEIELFSGGLYPPKTGAESGAAASQRAFCEELIQIRFDGREVLRQTRRPPMTWLGEPTVGINRAQAGSAEIAFTGEILTAQRGGFPALPGVVDANFGAVRMRLVLPAAAAGTAEPLLVMGEPGAALLAYVRVLPGGKIKLGAEVWGVGAYESAELAADYRESVEVVFAWPNLFPPVGDPRWGGAALPRQQQAASQLTVRVGDTTVLTQALPPPKKPWSNTELAVGTNPIGGSLVGSKFTGEILWTLREPLTPP